MNRRGGDRGAKNDEGMAVVIAFPPGDPEPFEIVPKDKKNTAGPKAVN